jgi:two-component system, NtrC family, response regulator HydG
MFDVIDKKFWRTVIDTMQEGLMLVEPDGKIMFINKALEKILGYSLEEVKGKSCEVFECDRCFKAREDGQDKYCVLFKEEKERSSQCLFRKKNGHHVHLLKNSTVIRNAAGKVVGGIENLTDLSKVVVRENVIATLRRQLQYDEGFQGIIGTSAIMRKVFDLLDSAAKSEAPVIILGESGVGKELAAAAIHNLSQRRDGPFIKVNCAALNDNLLESELFGHVKGAFTGANSSRIGRFEAANNGCIFLDEIGDLSLPLQTKLLRVLQEKEFERVGDHRTIKTDVRIITATHRNLAGMVENEIFRQDLFYRINVIPVNIPSLKERKNDISLLVKTFIDRIGKKNEKKINGISAEALELLVQYSWPGNIRELMNVIEYTFVICPGGIIELSHLPLSVQQKTDGKNYPVQTVVRENTTNQKQQLLEALKASEQNQTDAARILGVSRVTIWKRMKKYGIKSQKN